MLSEIILTLDQQTLWSFRKKEMQAFCHFLSMSYILFEAGLRSRQISSDSDSDSSLKISTPTPTPTPLWLRPSKTYSILKRALWCSHFLELHFHCIQTGDKAIQHPFALTADATGRAYRSSLWMWSVWQYLNLFSLSDNDRDGRNVSLYQLPYDILSLNDTSTTANLLLFLSFNVFNVFGRVHNRFSKIIVCCRLLTCDSGPESESAKFYRLQLWLWLRPKQSTPTDSNCGLDSNSAALLWRYTYHCSLVSDLNLNMTLSWGCSFNFGWTYKFSPLEWHFHPFFWTWPHCVQSCESSSSKIFPWSVSWYHMRWRGAIWVVWC